MENPARNPNQGDKDLGTPRPGSHDGMPAEENGDTRSDPKRTREKEWNGGIERPTKRPPERMTPTPKTR